MHIEPLVSQQPAIVYLDFKSPYAYLAVDATRRLEKELGLRFDWRPFVLDIPSYLGSASLDNTGQVAEQDRSTAQWAAVKYAYYDCRRYASVSQLTIRGTTKIWDTNLASTAMLWVREHAPEQLSELIDRIYTPFWKRELDIEATGEIAAILERCGLNRDDFTDWALDEGLETNAKFQKKAFDAGIYGVPTYVIGEELFFGREHLPRIAWHLSGENGVAPDIANLLPKDLVLNKKPSPQITVGVDNSIDSLLAIPKLKALFDRHSIDARWTRIRATTMEELIPPSVSNPRSDLHREYRLMTQDRNQKRYQQGIKTSGNLSELIQQELNTCKIRQVFDQEIDALPSPFPGVSVTLNDEIFIGRQHLPLISALLS